MKHMTKEQLIAVILGNVILGFGCALLALSGMGNDPFSASTMAISTGLGIHLGTYQLMINVVIFMIQLWCGRNYIGLGTIINFVFLGYIVEFSLSLLHRIFGSNIQLNLWQQILLMLIALIILTFGLAMYQVATLGVAPYDFLALKIADRFPIPYFIVRICTDAGCICLIILAVIGGLINWNGSHLGAGTIICAFFLGPAVSFFSSFHRKWIKQAEVTR